MGVILFAVVCLCLPSEGIKAGIEAEGVRKSILNFSVRFRENAVRKRSLDLASNRLVKSDVPR